MIGVVSFLWSVGSAVVRSLTHAGVLRAVSLGVPVISVGNLQAGGGGKTPLVAQIAREALERGLRVCILSRGYRGEWERTGGVVAPSDSCCNPLQTGDEPALLHQLVPGAWLGVGRDRVAAFRRVQRSAGQLDCVILDDGFQHWKIKKDIEVLALTSRSRSQVPYRDFGSASRFADLRVWTKGEIPPFGAPDVPTAVVRFRLSPAAAEQRLLLVTGVADPGEVRRSAQEAGYRVEKEIRLEDHVEYRSDQIQSWLRQAAEQGLKVAVTGKDWVKWRAVLPDGGEEVVVLEPELNFVSGRDVWNRVLWERSFSGY